MACHTVRLSESNDDSGFAGGRPRHPGTETQDVPHSAEKTLGVRVRATSGHRCAAESGGATPNGVGDSQRLVSTNRRRQLVDGNGFRDDIRRQRTTRFGLQNGAESARLLAARLRMRPVGSSKKLCMKQIMAISRHAAANATHVRALMGSGVAGRKQCCRGDKKRQIAISE